MRISDWSSDVCSSDLVGAAGRHQFLAFGGFGSVGFRCLFGLQVENIIAVGQLAGAARRFVARYHAPDRRQDIFHRRLSRQVAHAGPLRRSEEHTSELQSIMRISYDVFCLKKKTETQY